MHTLQEAAVERRAVVCMLQQGADNCFENQRQAFLPEGEHPVHTERPVHQRATCSLQVIKQEQL